MSLDINYPAIAKGYIDILTDNERAALAFGLIEHTKFEAMLSQIWLTIGQKFSKEGLMEGLDPQVIADAIRPDVKIEVRHELAVAIYSNVEMVV